MPPALRSPPLDPFAAVVHPDPYPWYRGLASARPVAYDERVPAWVVAGDEAVAAVLGDERFTVRPPDDGGPHALLVALARTTDGILHARHRAATVAQLGGLDPEALRAIAASAASDLASTSGGVTLADLDRIVVATPVVALGRALGLGPVDADRLVAWVAAVARGPAVPLAATEHAAVLAAAHELTALTGGWPATAALVQTLDATAGLVGNALVARARGAAGDVGELVRATAERDPPVHNTRRWATCDVDVHGHRVAAGMGVVVVLASTSASFGLGPHRCPGEALAIGLATGAVDALDSAVAPLTPHLTRPRYRPRPNVRIPWFAAGEGPAS